MRGVIILLALLVCAIPVYGTSIHLLAYSENASGSVAQLHLETQPGSGKVFVQTNVLMQTDTQLSLRLAKEIVCTQYNLPCAEYDFFYSIDAFAPTVMGPSGGAAAAVLTYAHVTGNRVPSSIGLTGTINSGGFIGNVGGLSEKIAAADRANLRNVYIPFGNQINNSESTGVGVFEAGSLDDILNDLYGIPERTTEFEVPQEFTSRMSGIAEDICVRAEALVAQGIPETLSLYNISEVGNLTNMFEFGETQLERAATARAEGRTYSEASFCFGATLRLRYLDFLQTDIDDVTFLSAQAVQQARNAQRVPGTDINDIQIHALVGERIRDAERAFQEAEELREDNEIIQAIDRYAYAYERSQTALLWSTFFGIPGKQIIGSEQDLQYACEMSIEEARSRIQYVRFYTSLDIAADTTLSEARTEQRAQRFESCIFTARKAKAEADVVGSVFGVGNISNIISVKERLALQSIAARTTAEEMPIIGLSYLEYAQSLEEIDPFSALLYYQLAQELSYTDVFFETPSEAFRSDPIGVTIARGFLIGFILSLALILLARNKT